MQPEGIMACRATCWFRQKSNSFVVLQDTSIKVLCWVSEMLSEMFFWIGTYPVSAQSHDVESTVLRQSWWSRMFFGWIHSGPADSATVVNSSGLHDVARKLSIKNKQNFSWGSIEQQCDLKNAFSSPLSLCCYFICVVSVMHKMIED